VGSYRVGVAKLLSRRSVLPGRTARLEHLPAVFGVCLISGLVLGSVDLAAQKILPYPWANLANSSAVWALGAFALGSCLRLPFRRAAVAGVVVLVVAVESYYLTATLVQDDSLTNLTQPSTQIWLLFAVLAGVVFAVAGSWAATGALLLRPLGVAIAGSVLIAEALVFLYRSSSAGSNRTEDRQTALIEAILGLLIVLLLARTKRRRVIAYGLSVPLSGLGFLAFLAAGFGE
jgi:Family of unknown function (DUF6518)